MSSRLRASSNWTSFNFGGVQDERVNGSACSIEMFFGKEALNDDDGKLRPLRWTAWNPRAQRYQGEFDAKPDMQSAFLRLMKTGDPDQLRARFADMDMLLHAIFEAFNDAQNKHHAEA